MEAAEGCGEAASEGEDKIQTVAIKYNKLIGNIKKSGRKCLDLENEQLRNDFQVRSEAICQFQRNGQKCFRAKSTLFSIFADV